LAVREHFRRAGWPEAERDERREALHRVLTAATVHGADAGVHYYQGMHDVASVLLFVAGERPAYRMLCHLSTCHLRDCTRRVVACPAAAGKRHDSTDTSAGTCAQAVSTVVADDTMACAGDGWTRSLRCCRSCFSSSARCAAEQDRWLPMMACSDC